MAKSKKKSQNKQKKGQQKQQSPQGIQKKSQGRKNIASTAKSLKGKATEYMPNVREFSTEGKIAWWLILGLLFLIPLAIGNGPLSWMNVTFVDGFDGVKVLILRVGVMAILGMWIWDVVRNGGEIRYHRIYILIGILLGWIVLTTILSINPATAFLGKYRRYDGAWSYFLYAILLFLTMQYATTMPRIRQLAQALSWSSFFVAGYGLLQALGMDILTWGPLPFEPNRSFSTFGNPNLLAGFLAFGFFINLSLILTEERQNWRRWYWLVLLLNSVVAITAFSRSLWIALPAAAIVFAIIMWRQKEKGTKEDWLLTGGIAAIVSGFIAYSLTRVDAVMNFWTRVQTIFEFDSGSGLTRFQIWQAAISAIGDRPIFGFGLDTFRLIFRHYAPPEYAQAAGFRSVADNVHNFPLQLATGIGIVGALIFFAVLFWVAYLALRWCLKTDEGESLRADRILLAGFFCACIAYMVHLFFGLSLPSTSFILWIFMGVLLVPHAKTVHVKQSAWMFIPAILLSVALLVPVTYAARLSLADHAYGVPAGLIARGIGSTDTATIETVLRQDAERMVRLNPWYERYYLDYFVIVSHLAMSARSEGNPNADAMIAEAKQKGEHLIAMSEWEYDSYLAVATFLMNIALVTGGQEGIEHMEEARDFMREKIEFVPTGLALRMRYADALIALGEIDEAREQLQFVIDHDTNHPTAAETLQRLNDDPNQFPMLRVPVLD